MRPHAWHLRHQFRMSAVGWAFGTSFGIDLAHLERRAAGAARIASFYRGGHLDPRPSCRSSCGSC
jgi:hypothetical protein